MTEEKLNNLNFINNKWKSLIIYNLYSGSKKFTYLLNLSPTISQSALCENLKELEIDNLIIKKYFYEHPPRVEYFLTSKGYEYAKLIKEFEKLG